MLKKAVEFKSMTLFVTKTDRQTMMIHFLEFFFVGLVMGITEDLLAIHFATDAKITIYTIKVAFLVALPFAIISEALVDLKILRKILRKIIRQKTNSLQQQSKNLKNTSQGRI